MTTWCGFVDCCCVHRAEPHSYLGRQTHTLREAMSFKQWAGRRDTQRLTRPPATTDIFIGQPVSAVNAVYLVLRALQRVLLAKIGRLSFAECGLHNNLISHGDMQQYSNTSSKLLQRC